MTEETVSYMMVFCALLMVRNARAGLGQSLPLLPLAGPAKDLAEHLARSRGAA
jgi:hypothetical protein